MNVCIDSVLGECALPALMNWTLVLHQKLYSGTGDVAAYDGKTSSDESCGSLSGRQMLLQQPFNAYTSSKKCFYRLRPGKSKECLVTEMARIFQVSKQAMRIRWKFIIYYKLGLVRPSSLRGLRLSQYSKVFCYLVCSQLSEHGRRRKMRKESVTVQKCKNRWPPLI